MARVVKLAGTIRNNWKKSVFGVVAGLYGINYAIDSYEINRLMRACCEEASSYGERTHAAHQQLDNVLVLLNPVADKRSSPETFETYCAPILHLAGLSIDVIKTESEGHARQYIEQLDELPQTILCAGGDGTVSEVVTGLFRRKNQSNETKPIIGVLPTGRTNAFAENLFSFQNTSRVNRVKGLANASISVVRGNKRPKDVVQIEVLENGSPSTAIKPVYALGTIEWSTFNDAFQQRDRYWYVGPLRQYAAVLFTALGSKLHWQCNAKLSFTQPCAGCSNCYVRQSHAHDQQSPKPGWLSAFMPTFKLGSSQTNANEPDFSKIHNDNCMQRTNVECQSGGIALDTSNVRRSDTADDETAQSLPQIHMKIMKSNERFKFISSGWRRLGSKAIDVETEYGIRSVDIEPILGDNDTTERYFYVDNESYEVKSIRVTLLPNLINFFVA